MTPAVLFARSDSVYKTLGADVWDVERDAMKWPGGVPVVAHPPCRLWGRLRKFSTAPKSEMELARWAVRQVRQFGGVLEHPAGSLLWADQGLPLPGQRDAFRGFTVALPQFWFGHRADKATWLYVVGCEPAELPEIALVLGDAPCVVEGTGSTGRGRTISKREREATPLDFAGWLLEVARVIARKTA